MPLGRRRLSAEETDGEEIVLATNRRRSLNIESTPPESSSSYEDVDDDPDGDYSGFAGRPATAVAIKRNRRRPTVHSSRSISPESLAATHDGVESGVDDNELSAEEECVRAAFRDSKVDISCIALQARYTGICKTDIKAWHRAKGHDRGNRLGLQAEDGDGDAIWTPSCTELRSTYNKLLADRVDKFIEYWLEENIGYGILKNVEDPLAVGTTIDSILTTMDPDIREALFAGDLPRRFRSKPHTGLRQALSSHSRQAMDTTACQPCIYGNFLVSDADGLSPTYNELKAIAMDLERYREDDRFANEIDRVKRTYSIDLDDSMDGVRKYLSSGSGKNSSAERLTILRQFCSALRTRIRRELKETGTSPDDPLLHPMSEWGFTVNAKARERSHKRHRGSNWLMNLTEALCIYRYGSKYGMRVFVVYCIPLPIYSPFAEAFITVIGQDSLMDSTECHCGFQRCCEARCRQVSIYSVRLKQQEVARRPRNLQERIPTKHAA